VVARFQGRGSARILLLAHMDTVYERGMLAQQPFRIDGDRAYGLGIADDKHGIAVILHALTMLKALSVDGYGVITVVMSPDEEVGSLAERDLLTKLGAGTTWCCRSKARARTRASASRPLASSSRCSP